MPVENAGTRLKNMPANHRHERHHRHGSKKMPYLKRFLNDDNRDDEMTVIGSMIGNRHAKTLYLKAYDAHDGDDGQLQGLSKLDFSHHAA